MELASRNTGEKNERMNTMREIIGFIGLGVTSPRGLADQRLLASTFSPCELHRYEA